MQLWLMIFPSRLVPAKSIEKRHAKKKKEMDASIGILIVVKTFDELGVEYLCLGS